MNGSIDGNDREIGKFSSGFYDVKKYERETKLNPKSSPKLRMDKAHIGVVITSNHKIIIEDKYVDIASTL